MWKQSSLDSVRAGPGSAPVLALALAPVLAGAACRQDMHDQPRYKPLATTTFFKDGTSARELVPGTVARGFLREDTELYTGRTARKDHARARPRPAAPPLSGPAAPEGVLAGATDKEQLAAWTALRAAEAAGGAPERDEAAFTATFPFPVTLEVMARGRERFEIFCSPCHDRAGTGNGMIVRKGFSRPPSLHVARLRDAKVGHFFNVITQGFGSMPSYAAQVPPEDRWAIIGYIRALQLSQWAPIAMVPPEGRAALGISGRRGP